MRLLVRTQVLPLNARRSTHPSTLPPFHLSDFRMNAASRWFAGISLLSVLPSASFAQDSTRHHLRAFAAVGTLPGASGRTPFWLTANQFGIVPKTPQAALVQAGIRYQMPLGRSRNWGVETVLEAVGQSNNPGVRVILPEAFVRLHYRNWELLGGRRRTIVGFQDSTLSAGGAIWSGNALPMPEVRFGTVDYVSFPVLKKWFAFKAHYNHAWFENSRPFVQNAYLHSKSLYIRFGKATWPVRFHAGASHFVQWAGYAPALKDDPGVYSQYGHFEKSWLGYWRAVLARSLNEKYFPGQVPSDISLDLNRVGNHLGTADLAMEIRLRGGRVFLYNQSFIEDGSLFFLKSVVDGLRGVRWFRTNQPRGPFSIDRVTVENVYTMNQGGPIFDINVGPDRGRDNYFNHNQYRDGWSYFRRTIGTPFIPPDTDLAAGLPRPGHNEQYATNNRVWVVHGGMAGRAFGRFTWEAKGSYSMNFGSYAYPLSPYGVGYPQISGLLRMATRLPSAGGLEVNGALAWDGGSLYDNAVGVYLGVRKDWNALTLSRAKNRAPHQSTRKLTSPQRF